MKRTVQTSLLYKRPVHPDLIHRMLACKIKQKVARQKTQRLMDEQ